MPDTTIRPITLDDIRAARARIAGTVIRTPLVKLELGAGFPDIRLKLENLQPINSYKLRGAANAVAQIPMSERARGVWTISAGNAGQGVAYAARQAGIPCSVVVLETAPLAKLDRMRALGATLIPVPVNDAWAAMGARAYPGMNGVFIHPFDDHDFITGHATMGIEIFEDVPDVSTVIAAVGGGGLLVGVGSAMKALKPDVTMIGVEPETGAPAARSFATGSAQEFPDWTPTFVDGAGGRMMFPRMWDRLQPVADEFMVVTIAETTRALRMLAEKSRVIAEGAGALSLAAALKRSSARGPIVAIVSGGNIDMSVFSALVGAP